MRTADPEKQQSAGRLVSFSRIGSRQVIATADPEHKRIDFIQGEIQNRLMSIFAL